METKSCKVDVKRARREKKTSKPWTGQGKNFWSSRDQARGARINALRKDIAKNNCNR